MLLGSSYLGIDLGTESINVVQLEKRGHKKTIKSLYQMENPIGSTVFNKPEEKDAMLHCLLKINKKFPSNGVIIGISSRLAMFRHVEFPLLTKKELKEAIFWEMQEFSSVFNGEIIFDYELLDKRKNSHHVLLVAVPKDIIMNYTEVASAAGFSLKALDVYPLANARVLRARRKSNVTAIIDLSSSNSEMTVVDDGKIIFIRSIDICYSNTVNEEISSISNNKHWVDLISSDFIPTFYHNLFLEISRAFNFYSLQNKGRQIEEIVLIGKSNQIHHWKGVFKRFFNVEVYTGKEFIFDFTNKNIEIDNYHMDFFSAIGFALRG
jgi:type IV pilus assembly protein PilM